MDGDIPSFVWARENFSIDIAAHMGEFEWLLHRVITLSEEERFFLSKKWLLYAQNLIHRCEKERKAKDVELMKMAYYKIIGSKFEEELDKRIEEVKIFMEDLNSSSWKIEKETKLMKAYYKKETNNPIHSVKLEGIINSSVLNVLAVLYEVDLYSNWWPLSKDVRELKKFSKFKKIIYLVVDLPWPLWNRDCCLMSYGVDNLEDNHIFAMFRSCTPEEEKLVQVPKTEHTVRSEWQVGGILITPISENQTKVSILVNTDPKVNFIPSSVLNLFTKILTPRMFERLKNTSESVPGSEYENRMRNKPYVYQEARERLAAYFQCRKRQQIGFSY